MALQRQYLERKFAILQAYESDSEEEEVGSIVDKVSQVEEWIQGTDRLGNDVPDGPSALLAGQPPSNSQPVEHTAQGISNQPAGAYDPRTSQAQQAATNQPSNSGGLPNTANHIHGIENSRSLAIPPNLLNPRATLSVVGDFVPRQRSTPNVPRCRFQDINPEANVAENRCDVVPPPAVTMDQPSRQCQRSTLEFPLNRFQRNCDANLDGNSRAPVLPHVLTTEPPTCSWQSNGQPVNPEPQFTGHRSVPTFPLIQQPSEPWQRFSSNLPQNQSHGIHESNTARNRSFPHPAPTVRQPFCSQPSFIAQDQQSSVCWLNQSQLAARQAVPKDLPEFSGRAEDWPLFLAMFNSSTQMCGFSNEENMLRLRKCLRGEALNRVRCELLHPNNVASVMSTLKMLYGKPEAIIQAVIQKVRDLPAPKVDKLETLVDFALSVKNLCATIQACEIGDYMYSSSLRYELVERLPPALKLEWAKASRGHPVPSLLEFSTWLYVMAEDASTVMGIQNSESRSELKTRGKKEKFLNVHVESDDEQVNLHARDKQESSQTCIVCKGGCSSLPKCARFLEFSYDSRWATIKELKLCRKCLRRHNNSCNQKKACGINGCTYLHHPLLHTVKNPESESKTTSSPTTGGKTESSINVHQGRTSDVLFRFIPVVLYGPSKEVHTYAFIDDGSELTLLEQGLADELEISGQKTPLCLKWTGGTKRIEYNSKKVDLHISGIAANAKKFPLSNVRTVDKLEVRSQTMVISDLQKRFRHLEGLPIESYVEIAPRILIGLDHTSLGHVKKSREGKPKEPIAVKTYLGWCVYGCIAASSATTGVVNHHVLDICPCNNNDGDYLHNAMREYFSLDSMGVVQPRKLLMPTEDERSLQMLNTLTRRKGDRYESGLLWKYDGVRLPDSREMALKRWKCLERRLLNDTPLREALDTKIADYLSKGYIRKLTDAELAVKHSRIWYLPVFPVVNPNKPSKTRLVWDAAAKAHGVSLNSVLLKGPDFLTSLLGVLIRFREKRIAVCGDLREMYHQVLIREEDQHCQRFLWGREGGSSEPNVYVMQVMTFGACCSPSTAQYVKNEHAKLYQEKFPSAVEAIIEDHYVDDMLASVETEDEAVSLAREVKWIHQKGGFEMRNWLSSSPMVLAKLKENPVAEKNLIVSNDLSTEKILGMWWNTEKDYFTFKLSTRYEEELLSGRRRPTKREALRMLMLMYDPCGFIAHFLMYLKVLLQEIWRSKVDWNDKIRDEEFKKWLLWVKVLPKVQDVEIPRCYRNVNSINANVQVHTFVDASENGFAAAVYLRFQESCSIECAFVAAKTRVAPIRFLSIPRSELQAAILGVRLTKTVQQALKIKIRQRFFHTDSRDVCCWLNSDHRRYSQFVAFRVSEIMEETEVSEWHWIPSKQNVADLGTKWNGLPDLSSNSPWFHGPAFLWKPEEEWPATSRQYGTTDEELRPHLLVHTIALEPILSPELFSSWTTLLRRTAKFIRHAFNWRRRVINEEPLSGPLTQEELTSAENYLYRVAQRDAFADEVAVLQTNDSLSERKRFLKSSSIYRVGPMLDEKNVLRVQGRAGACKYIDVDAINPVILPREHTITKLVVAHFHRRFHHQNHESVVNELRQHYYIPHLKATYQMVRKDCQQCKNDRAIPCPPLMADLPLARVDAFTRPFTHTGVDYFGPFTISIGRRTEKRWGVLATCLTTRAIHLQIAYSLSTDSCIMALRNIFCRRGTPAMIYSDRGTNFQGTAKVFEEAVMNIDQDKLVAEFTSGHTKWKFNPPASPHMGGVWERLIRSVKQNLKKILGSKTVSAEVLENAMTEVENIVNSRPLTNVPVHDDLSPVLTPNHFLLQSSNGLKPFVSFDDSSRAVKNNHELSQILANSFWKQWLRDYLPIITRRSKWFTATKPIELNDIVIVADPKLPRNSWPKGRVIATNVASDGQVRSATVQTANGGIYERPAVNLAVLDVGVGENTCRMEPPRIPGECKLRHADQ